MVENMEKALITESILTDIANTIRMKVADDTLYKPAEMPAAIRSISSIAFKSTGITFQNGHAEHREQGPIVNFDWLSWNNTARQRGT